ncbi:hypothetical protein GOV11_04200 [Candidatus Woesearchaeota archaeon]|nr:hypothetical protein [Candidatus Woesearchaeota archaeon]
MAEAPVNEQTVDVPEPIVQSGGDTLTTFDDLEVQHEAAVRDEQLAVRKEEIEGKPTVDDKVAEEVQDPKEEPELQAKEEVTDAARDAALELKESLKPEKIKTYKLKSGDDEVSLRADTQVEVVVSGKQQTVKYQDLVDNYSGATHLRQELSKLRQEQHTFEQDRGDLQGAINDIYDKIVVKKDPEAGLGYLAEILGANPVEVINDIRMQMEPIISERAAMSPEQIEVMDMQQQMSLMKKREETFNQKTASQAQARDLEERTFGVLDSSGLSKEKFAEYYNELADSGDVTLEDITPEFIGYYHEDIQARDSLGTMLSEVSPGIGGEAMDSAVDHLRQVMLDPRNSDLTVTDMRDIAVEVFGSKASQNLTRKLEKSMPAQTNRGAPAKVANEDLWSFDQI